jgi:hypothetical protein
MKASLWKQTEVFSFSFDENHRSMDRFLANVGIVLITQ